MIRYGGGPSPWSMLVPVILNYSVSQYIHYEWLYRWRLVGRRKDSRWWKRLVSVWPGWGNQESQSSCSQPEETAAFTPTCHWLVWTGIVVERIKRTMGQFRTLSQLNYEKYINKEIANRTTYCIPSALLCMPIGVTHTLPREKYYMWGHSAYVFCLNVPIIINQSVGSNTDWTSVNHVYSNNKMHRLGLYLY